MSEFGAGALKGLRADEYLGMIDHRDGGKFDLEFA